VAWVVDTSLLIDVAENDPQFGENSARLLDRRRPVGLLVSPVSYVELAPLFNGVETAQNEFLDSIGVNGTVMPNGARLWVQTRLGPHVSVQRHLADAEV